MKTNLDTFAIIDAVGDAVVACDEAGAITLWNKAAERLFGYTEAEALGASLDIIIPERMRKRHWDGYHETMRTGVTKYGHDVLRVPAIDKAGNALSISFTVTMLFSAGDKVESIVSVMRDETARFHQDRALRKRLAELEAQLAGGAPPAAPAPTTDAPRGGCPFAQDPSTQG
jgi:PAS domain S-box-containing protein